MVLEGRSGDGFVGFAGVVAGVAAVVVAVVAAVVVAVVVGTADFGAADWIAGAVCPDGAAAPWEVTAAGLRGEATAAGVPSGRRLGTGRGRCTAGAAGKFCPAVLVTDLGAELVADLGALLGADLGALPASVWAGGCRWTRTTGAGTAWVSCCA